MKRKHEMPFGAECRQDGTVRFRLWAPKAASIAVRLSELERDFPMSALQDGWFEVVTESRAGTQYQFKIDNQHSVPDPASRFQTSTVHGASEIVDPLAYEWRDTEWNGRPWEEAVIYELHVGTFSREGTFAGAEAKLDYLSELGITAVELMPLSSFPGERNWGYDGVLPYAPPRCYGRPEDLKHFIDAAHAKNLMVFLDVVYNHFGPDGNYLWLYAPQFFTNRHRTPWGQAINFDDPDNRIVRDYFIHNSLYWLEEYHFDGLRFDAVHAIADDSRPHILAELAETIRSKFANERHIHLILENDDNAVRYLRRDAEDNPFWYTAQWNDDIHHVLHVLLTGETDGYYSDYTDNPAQSLGRCLGEGYAYQGEPSAFRDGASRGEPSRELPATCFVSFLQNHDQIGNRALGERIVSLSNPAAVRAAMAILLLAPSPPLLFMGEEFGAETPFLFFCDFASELADKVRDGRRAEFARFKQFRSPEAQARIPDPNDPGTFLASKLDWVSFEQQHHCEWLQFYREVLTCRREKIMPQIQNIVPGLAQYDVLGSRAVHVRWGLAKGGSLELITNLGQDSTVLRNKPDGKLLYTTGASYIPTWEQVPPLSSVWFLKA
ncbi:MAG: 1,4-alpha-glucan branching protein [Acidobacteriaceae bacterium]|jgi:maltooligosyltrehalose trehalohydrolase|nr:1,4-alpha-glucan branching protein [Acidobacteriaceae bacterium]